MSQDASDVGKEGAAGQRPTGSFLCHQCGEVMKERYYSFKNALLCTRCTMDVRQDIGASRTKRRFLRAALFGFGGAIAGAAFYGGVMLVTNLEIAIAAIVTGFIVGWSVRKGARGIMRRRYQWLALVMTYFSLGLSFSPMAIKAARESNFRKQAAARAEAAKASSDSGVVVDSTTVPRAATITPKTHRRVSAPRAFLALLVLMILPVIFILGLPVLYVFSTMPGGIISAAIMGFALMQAWKMTAGGSVEIAGPYRIGDALPKSA